MLVMQIVGDCADTYSMPYIEKNARASLRDDFLALGRGGIQRNSGQCVSAQWMGGNTPPENQCGRDGSLGSSSSGWQSGRLLDS